MSAYIANYSKSALLIIKSVTQVHVGVGRVGGIVDLPVQRDEFGFPCIYSSSLKGTTRSSLQPRKQEFPNLTEDEIKKILQKFKECYGSEVGETTTIESKLLFTDAHLVAMPVRSLYGVYAYVTSPLLLRRLAQKMELACFRKDGLANELSKVEDVKKGKAIVIGDNKSTVFKSKEGEEKAVLVEEFELSLSRVASELKGLSEILDIEERPILIVNDEDAKRIIDRSMVIATRVALEKNKKKVQTGKLWTEEYVPQFTVFASLVLSKDANCYQEEFKEKLDSKRKYLIIGGKETVGKGIIKVEVKEGGSCESTT